MTLSFLSNAALTSAAAVWYTTILKESTGTFRGVRLAKESSDPEISRGELLEKS